MPKLARVVNMRLATTSQYQLGVASTTALANSSRQGMRSSTIFARSLGRRFSATTRSSSSATVTTLLFECRSIPPYFICYAHSLGLATKVPIAPGKFGRYLPHPHCVRRPWPRAPLALPQSQQKRRIRWQRFNQHRGVNHIYAHATGQLNRRTAHKTLDRPIYR